MVLKEGLFGIVVKEFKTFGVHVLLNEFVGDECVSRVLWGNTAEAIGLYQHYVQAYCSKKKDEARPPLAPFDEDREELLAQGIDGLDISLMRDILQRPA